MDGDYIVDEKARTATLTARGIAKAEEFFHLENLSDPENSTIAHHINQAIKAHGTMKRDVDYVVKDGEIIIVDEFTGRLMFGRRYSEGLHQAIEAKEHVSVQRERRRSLPPSISWTLWRSPPTVRWSVSTTRTPCTKPSRGSTGP